MTAVNNVAHQVVHVYIQITIYITISFDQLFFEANTIQKKITAFPNCLNIIARKTSNIILNYIRKHIFWQYHVSKAANGQLTVSFYCFRTMLNLYLRKGNLTVWVPSLQNGPQIFCSFSAIYNLVFPVELSQYTVSNLQKIHQSKKKYNLGICLIISYFAEW